MKFLILLASVLAFAAANSTRGRIYRGSSAEQYEYPYQAGIQLLKEEGESWCGGTLIDNTWVLSAAHCFEDSADGNITVFLGGIYRKESVYSFRIKNDDVIIHEYFDTDRVENDIALIPIPRVMYSAAVSSAKLPPKGFNATFVNRFAIASGWGYGGDTGYLSIELQWARFKIITKSKCAESYPGDKISDQDLCAVGVKKGSTCGGDSGGPLLEVRSRILVGIISTVTLDGCEEGKPVLFTRVSYYREWITNKTGI